MALISAMAPVLMLPQLPLRSVGLFVDAIPTVNTVISGADRRSFGGRFWGPTIDPILIPTEFDCEGDEEILPSIDLEGSEAFMPWTIVSGIECSAMPLDEGNLGDVVVDEVRKSLSASLAYAATQTAPTFLNLSDSAVDQGSFAEAAGAFQAVEEGLGNLIGNRRGYVIMNVGLLAKAMDASAVVERGGMLQTASGHLVVADAGALSGVVYGTGQIAYSISDARLIDDNGSLNITRDTVRFLAQAEGLIVYNPSTVVSADVEPETS